jgi:hypothetical protein
MTVKSSTSTMVSKTDIATSASNVVQGSVQVRGVVIGLDSNVGKAFVVDCARNTEGLISDLEVKTKYELSDAGWEKLANNGPLLHAVQAERERRIFSGEAPREAAQRHLVKAPSVLNSILTDEQIAPRHRIEAAKELRQAAGNGPDAASKAGEKVIITINLGADTLRFEETIAPFEPPSDEEGPP